MTALHSAGVTGVTESRPTRNTAICASALAFFYHSSTDPSAIVGICEVQREAYPDPTALDPAHAGYDPDSSPAKPTWYMVDLRAVAPLPTPVTLAMIKKARALAQMAVLRVGRLSVTPVTPAEWKVVIALSRA